MADKTLLRSTLIHQYTVPDTETEASSSVLYIIALVSLYDRDNRMGASKTLSTAPCIFSKAVINKYMNCGLILGASLTRDEPIYTWEYKGSYQGEMTEE